MDDSLHLGNLMTQQQNAIIEQAVKNERKKLLQLDRKSTRLNSSH